MTIRCKRFVLTPLLLFIYYSPAVPSIAQAQTLSPTPTPLSLEQSAHAVKNAVTVDNVMSLANQVFAYPHRFEIPPEVEAMAKSRLVAVEVSYLTGGRPGVDESDIALFINLMADRLRLPAFVKTSNRQIRLLRMQCVIAHPAFMGRGLGADFMSSAQSIPSTMSPLQAVHLIRTLIDQKFYNPQYQLPIEEWERHHSDMSSGDTISQTAKQDPAYALRRKQLEAALSNAISAMTPADAFQIFSEALVSLKLQ